MLSPSCYRGYGDYLNQGVPKRKQAGYTSDRGMARQRSRTDVQHGKDGLSNLADTHPEYTPPALKDGEEHAVLTMDKRPSWEVILEILEQEEEGSVTIVALGPRESSFHLRVGGGGAPSLRGKYKGCPM